MSKALPRALVALTLCGVAFGCREEPGEAKRSAPAASAPPAQLQGAAPAAAAPQRPAVSGSSRADIRSGSGLSSGACQARIAALQKLPELPGAPGFEARRAQLLMRTSGAPVVFTRAPQPQPDSWLGLARREVILAYRKHLAEARWAEPALKGLMNQLAGQPALLRAVLLTEGYLYTEEPELARALERELRLEQLFDAPELVLQRGNKASRLVRGPQGVYTHRDGPLAGLPAKLLFLDRISEASAAPSPALHMDLSWLQDQLGFERVRLLHLTEDQWSVELGYRGDTGQVEWVAALLAREAAGVRQVCSAEPRASASRAQALARRRQAVWKRLEAVIARQISEELPFDEPDNEWGQQDGHMRQRWAAAYAAGEAEFELNLRKYPVFTQSGAPRTPQVCIDFITETLERSSGTYYPPRGELPKKRVGLVDFDAWLGERRRSVQPFVDLAKSNPAFDVRELKASERVPYQFRQRFFTRLEQLDDFRQGDIVIIRGYAPWDMNHTEHSHSFFIYRTDPVSGAPIRVVGNAGRPELRGWDREMSRAPRRSIRQRIRPQLPWLERVTAPSRGASEAG